MQEFIAISPSMQEIKRLSTLMRNTRVHIIIIGESGVGKSKLAKEIAPNACVVDALSQESILEALKQFDEIIIENFDKQNIVNFDTAGKRIIATSKTQPRDSISDKLFGLTVELLPLSKRQQDIPALIEYFMNEASQNLNLAKTKFDLSQADISQNCHSLKRCVYQELLSSSTDDTSFMHSMKNFLVKKIEIDDNYHEFLQLFDKAIILANQEKYKSQLMMSKMMGINRNTLRKKMALLGIDDD